MYKTAARKKTEFDLYDDLEKIKEALSNATYDVKGRAGEMLSQSFEDFKEKTTGVKDDVATFVSDKPFKTMGIALAAGLVIGYLLHK